MQDKHPDINKTNYYKNKKGELIQKVTIHLPRKMVFDLKIEAITKRITLSELVRQKLK